MPVVKPFVLVQSASEQHGALHTEPTQTFPLQSEPIEQVLPARIVPPPGGSHP